MKALYVLAAVALLLSGAYVIEFIYETAKEKLRNWKSNELT